MRLGGVWIGEMYIWVDNWFCYGYVVCYDGLDGEERRELYFDWLGWFVGIINGWRDKNLVVVSL